MEVQYMPQTERVNPKTGKKQYRALFTYYSSDGKLHYNNTGWCGSPEEAKEEAKKRKKIKEAEISLSFQRQDKLLATALEEFVKEYKERADRETTDNTCTEKSLSGWSRTIFNKYMPLEVKRAKLKDITPVLFRNWITYINDQDLSGAYIRNLRYTLTVFNWWLEDHNYYTDGSLANDIDLTLARKTLKSKTHKNRELSGERNLVSTFDVERICEYFFDQGIEEFSNFYYYTLYYILFYTGLRPEELIGLTWQYVDLSEDKKEIKIRNSITEKEKRTNVRRRMARGKLSTKNLISKRTIPILDYIYELFVDYRDSYKYEFNVSNEEMAACFVFPKLSTHDPHDYQAPDQPTRKLKTVLGALKLPNTDCQMFRHSFATYLILPKPAGLGYTKEQVMHYFGHADTNMLSTVYARITEAQKANTLKTTFAKYYHTAKTKKQAEKAKEQKKHIRKLQGDNPEAAEYRKERIYKQIDKAIAREQEKYYYLSKDRWIINDYIKDKIEASKCIIFIEED